MRFKRLEIQGYKSFATKTVFEIDPGITSVVGPNGSGKSNVMDALRWVTGETATSQMRAKRLEEVIFAGSEKRAPAGMADVSIVLNNQDRWLPLDFAEVTVARRVHRSGDSEFLINGNRVRLRDIQELFASSGLGPGSYSLMGQGLVDEVLHLKSEERRELIEDVADVRRHRQKMIEGRRKCEAAHENLERARLLVEEIGPRLRTLERQAKRAIQYAEIQTELQSALRRFYGREWRRLQEDLGTRRETLAQRRAERDRAVQAVADAEAALESWTTALREARARLDGADAERRRVGDSVRDLEHQQEMAQQLAELLQRRTAELREDLAGLEREAESSVAGTVGAEGEEDQIAALEANGATAQAALEAAEAELRDRSAALEVLRAQAAEAEGKFAQLDRSQSDDERRLQQITTERTHLEHAAPAREQRVADLHERLVGLEAEANAATDRDTAAAQAATDARARREELAQRFYAVSAHLRSLEASRANRDRRLARARDRLQMLRELQAESEGMNQGLRALFGSRGVPREGESSGIPGVVGVLRHLIRAPKGLERGVEAALEDYIDAVIFERSDEALGTIHALITERAGRIVALPLDSFQRRSPLAIRPERGVIGVVSTLVRCDGRYRELVDGLLGRTILVEDVETGRALLKRALGVIVTRDGHLLRKNGSIVGGQVAEAGAFARENELQSLPEQIRELERSLAESANLDDRRAEVETIERELREAEQANEAAAADRAAAQEDAASRLAEQMRVQTEIAALEAEATRNAAAIDRLAEEAQRLAAARIEREAERSSITAQRPSAEALAESDRASIAQIEIVSRAAARLSTTEGERNALREALQAREAARARAREQHAARTAQIGEIETEIAALTRAIAERETALTEARTVRDAQTSVDAAQSAEARAVAQLLTQETERPAAVRTAQHTQIETERLLVAAEAAVQGSESALARLEEQTQADGLRIDARGQVAAADGKAEVDERGKVQTQGTAVAARIISQATSLHNGSGNGHRGSGHGHENGNGGGGYGLDASADVPGGVDIVEEPLEELREQIETLRGRLRWLGTVNPDAASEYNEFQERYDYLNGQIADLEGGEQRMITAEAELAGLIKERFQETFAAVDQQFRRYFRIMFPGGRSKLALTDEADWESTGVEIVAQPPGKRVESLTMLSGGERSLTAIALLFAMLEVRPSPFCVLDEVDAALDEVNVGRFVDALKALAAHTQFVVITHNRGTIEQADSIYGITMGDDSVSRVLSVRLADLQLDE